MSEKRQSNFQSISIASTALTRDAKNVGQLKCFKIVKMKEGMETILSNLNSITESLAWRKKQGAHYMIQV